MSEYYQLERDNLALQRERLDDTARVLRASRRILADGAWTVGENARDAYGERVHPLSPRAVKFCAVGAIQRAASDLGSPWAVAYAVDYLEGVVGHVPDFNDAQGSVDGVLEAIDRALLIIERDAVELGARGARGRGQGV